MENEKIVEEKNVEKKPKNSPISYVIGILILAAVAYAYFCTDMIRTRPVSQEGSQFVGTYEYEPSYFIASDGEKVYYYGDVNGVPIDCALILKEDGTGSFREFNDNLDETESLIWKEVNGTVEICRTWSDDEDDPLVLTKENNYYVTENSHYSGKWFKVS